MEGTLAKTVSVVGIGKLGGPLADILDTYFKVIRIDKESVEGATNSFSNLGDITFVIVPTPSMANDKFSSEYVENVLSNIKKKQIVVIISTLMPGETDRLQTQFPNLTLLYNPTFVALGSVEHDFVYPDFVLIGGKDNHAIEVLKNIHKTICQKEPKFSVLKPLEAEIAKISLNCYITFKITFANLIGKMCYYVHADADKILSSIGQDSRIGNKYFKSGFGYGGPCFPRDNLALSAYMRDNEVNPVLLETVNHLNQEQVDFMVERIKMLKPTTIGFAGVSYKKGTDVCECSQLKSVFDILQMQGYKVKIGTGDVNVDWEGIHASNSHRGRRIHRASSRKLSKE